MLNIGGGELLIILLVALIFLGPARLPDVARQIGQTLNTMRGLARGFQAELEAAARPDALLPASSSGEEGAEPARLADRARTIGRTEEADVRPVSAGGPRDLASGSASASDEEE